MALGGLDTGRRKEKDVDSVVGIRTYSGLTWMASACRNKLTAQPSEVSAAPIQA